MKTNRPANTRRQADAADRLSVCQPTASVASFRVRQRPHPLARTLVAATVCFSALLLAGCESGGPHASENHSAQSHRHRLTAKADTTRRITAKADTTRHHPYSPNKMSAQPPSPSHSDASPENSGDQSHSAAERQHLRGQLTPLQFEVVCNEATEPPFRNAYWDNKEAGIYVDIVSGEPLFSSLDKYDSGSGWPSFTRPLKPQEVIELSDTSHGMVRTEVRSKSGKAHLGHVFPDGPAPTGLRYCINSASLRFIPVADLEKEGYGEYKALFQ